MKKIISFIVMITMMFSLTTVFAQENKKLIVGTNAEFSPFEYIENDYFVGFDIELMRELGKIMGYEIEFENMAFDALLPSVTGGKVDCAIAGMTVTEERKHFVSFSDYYIDYSVKYSDVEDIEKEYYAIPVNKNNTKLLQEINNAISKAKTDGTIDALKAKYKLDGVTYYDLYGNILTIPSTPTDTNNNSFDDVPQTHWAYTYIEEMVKQGILTGYGNGKFGPEDTISRAQLATILCRVGGIDVSYNISNTFTDVSDNEWYSPYVEGGKYYLNGYVMDGKEYYKPNENAIREDISVALVKLNGYDTSVYDEVSLKNKFNDFSSIGTDARKYVYAAVTNNLISGYDDGSFKGQSSVTRAEAATMFYRAINSKGLNTQLQTVEGNIKFCDYQGNALLNKNDIAYAKAEYTPISNSEFKEWIVEIALNKNGRIKFANATEIISNYADGNNVISILLNNEIITCPVVNSKIDSDTVIITGAFTDESANELANLIMYGNPVNKDISSNNTEKLVIGITMFEPMNYMENGELVGFDTEFAKAVCNKLGFKPEFVEINWDEKELQLKSDRIDCVWNGLSYTEEREKNMDMSKPYMKNMCVLIVKNNKINSYTNNADGATVVAEIGSQGEYVIDSEQFFSKSNYVATNSSVEAIRAVASGEADIAVVDYFSLTYLANELEEFSNLAVVEGKEFGVEHYVIGFKNGSTLTNKVNLAITELINDGTLEKIAEKYNLSYVLLK